MAERPFRVTLCPVNTAGVPWTNAEALRRRGVDARLVVFERYQLHPEADWSLDRRGGLVRRQAQQWAAFVRLLPRTDVFHFHFGLTLVPQSLQFPLLRAAHKKYVIHYLGSDIRGKTPEQLAFGRKARQLPAELRNLRGLEGEHDLPAAARPRQAREIDRFLDVG